MSAPDRRHTTEVTTSRLRGGPSGGRETAVNNGQSRRPTDNQTYSLAAIIGRDGPQVRIWHARGQGSNPLSSTPGQRPSPPRRPPIPAVAQQICSNRLCAANAVVQGAGDAGHQRRGRLPVDPPHGA